MSFILAFDMGTTSVKVSVFNRELACVAHGKQEYRLLARGDFVELEPQVYWDTIRTALAQATVSMAAPVAEVSAIVVTTQGETILPVDRSGEALGNAVVWMDLRAGEQAEELTGHCGRRDFFARTGIPECTGMYPVTKLMWYRRHQPALYEKAHQFLLLEDYILFRLTGRFVTEKSLLCTSGYFNIGTDQYDSELLAWSGIEAAKLPEALECGDEVGVLTAQAADFLGLRSGVRVFAGAMDQTAGALGAGNLSPGSVVETTGSGMTITASTLSPDFGGEYLPVYRHLRSGLYLLAPVCVTAGQVLKWFKDEFCGEEEREAAAQGRGVYALLDEQAAQVSPAENPLLLLPYFSGVMQPDSNPHARGVFFGVGLETKKPHFIRAVLEAVAFQLRENLELIHKVSGEPVTQIRSLGGGAASRLWLQIKTDVTGRPISTMSQPECASLGAAILAAKTLGWYDSLEQAAGHANRVVETLEPDPKNRAWYDEKYARYLALYSRLRDFFQAN